MVQTKHRQVEPAHTSHKHLHESHRRAVRLAYRSKARAAHGTRVACLSTFGMPRPPRLPMLRRRTPPEQLRVSLPAYAAAEQTQLAQRVVGSNWLEGHMVSCALAEQGMHSMDQQRGSIDAGRKPALSQESEKRGTVRIDKAQCAKRPVVVVVEGATAAPARGQSRSCTRPEVRRPPCAAHSTGSAWRCARSGSDG